MGLLNHVTEASVTPLQHLNMAAALVSPETGLPNHSKTTAQQPKKCRKLKSSRYFEEEAVQEEWL